MKTTPPTKEHWVFAAGGYPLNTGERMQERILWHTLSWATDHPAIKGLVVYEASDYAQARGLRAPNGRLRSAERAVRLAATSRMPWLVRAISHRLTENLKAIPTPVDRLVVLAAEPGNAVRTTEILRGMTEGLRGWRQAARS